MIKALLSFALFLSISSVMAAQQIKVPAPTALKNKADYERYRPQFLEAVDWLTQKPLNTPGRAPVNSFVLAWISGTNDFTIQLQAYVMELTDKNPDLLLVFLGNWGRFALQKPEQKEDQLACNHFALQQLLDFYENAQTIHQDKDLEQLLKRRKKGKLTKWLQKQL